MGVHQRFLLQWWTMSTGRGSVLQSSRSITGVCSWRPSRPTMMWGMAHPPEHQCCHQGIGSLLPSSSCSASGSDQHHSADEDGIWREDAEVPKEEDITGGRSCLQAVEQLLWKIDHCEWTVKGLCFYLWTTSFEHVIRSDIVISTAVPPSWNVHLVM